MAGAVHLVNERDTASESSRRLKCAAWLETAVFICLAAVALLAPFSTKGAVNAFRAAAILWIISLFTRRRRLVAQPLAAPLLVFLALTGISSAFSLDPLLSWGRMRTVSLILLAIIVGQAVRSLRQVKILAVLLIGSCLLTVIYTGWQYTAGIGVKAIGTGSALGSLRRFGLAPGDILRKLGGTRIRSPHDLRTRQFSSGRVELLLWRETPNALQPVRISVDARALQTTLRSPGITLARARPPRAQGFFKHYFPFSEILVFVGLLIWGLAACGAAHPKLRVALMAAFLAVGIVLALTLTRISLASLIAGALLIAMLRGIRRFRWITAAGLVVVGLATLYWVQRDRSTPGTDPGTEYRLLMWRDSLGLIRAHPMLGVGLDGIAGDWQRWNLEAYRRFGLHSHFHSTPLQLAVECGLPALAAWVWLIAAYALFLIRLHRTMAQQDWFARGVVFGALGSLAGFVLTGFLQYNFGDSEAMIVFWMLTGLAFAISRLVPEVYPGRNLSPEGEIN